MGAIKGITRLSTNANSHFERGLVPLRNVLTQIASFSSCLTLIAAFCKWVLLADSPGAFFLEWRLKRALFSCAGHSVQIFRKFLTPWDFFKGQKQVFVPLSPKTPFSLSLLSPDSSTLSASSSWRFPKLAFLRTLGELVYASDSTSWSAADNLLVRAVKLLKSLQGLTCNSSRSDLRQERSDERRIDDRTCCTAHSSQSFVAQGSPWCGLGTCMWQSDFSCVNKPRFFHFRLQVVPDYHVKSFDGEYFPLRYLSLTQGCCGVSRCRFRRVARRHWWSWGW